MSPPARGREQLDPVQVRAKLFFLSAGLDHVMTHVEECQRLARDLEIPMGPANPSELPLDQLRRLREDVSRAIFATGEVRRTV